MQLGNGITVIKAAYSKSSLRLTINPRFLNYKILIIYNNTID